MTLSVGWSAKCKSHELPNHRCQIHFLERSLWVDDGNPRRKTGLLFDAQARVMLVRYAGVVSSDDIASIDGFVKNFVASEGYIRSIYDLTPIEAFAISWTRLSERGRKLRMKAKRPGAAPGALARSEAGRRDGSPRPSRCIRSSWRLHHEKQSVSYQGTSSSLKERA
jgi:hypothetical protein